MSERDPRYFKVYQDGDDRNLERQVMDIINSGAAPGIDTQARREIEEIQRAIENGEIGGGGSGIDQKAREDIQQVTAQLADTVKEINGVKPTNGKVTIPVPDTSKLATKTELQAISSGSPKGTYETYEALQEAFPTGDANIYVVSSDGYWYYWKGAYWEPGGMYQSTGIADNTINEKKLADDVFNSIYNTLALNWVFGTVNSTTGIPSDSTTRIRTQKIAVNADTVINFSDSANVLYYNVARYNKNGSYLNQTGFIRDGKYRFTEELDVVIILAYRTNGTISDPNALIPSIEVYKRALSDKVSKNELNSLVQTKMGKEEKKPISSRYYWSDFSFVGDELWAFRPSDDNMAISPGVGAIYIFDEGMNLKKRLLHDFGHVNTVDYKPETDSLIFGNGSGLYGTEGEFYIIKGVKHWGNLPEDTMLNLKGNISGSIVRTINVGLAFGDKVNVCWGEDNNGLHNICYVLANDNTEIRRLLLGRGTNQFENGQFVSEVAADEMNGTYKELKYWYNPKIEVNQGTCYYNGYLWCAMGHDGLFMVRMKLNNDGSISTEIKQELAYKDDGTPITFASEGVAVKDGMLYHATFNGVNAVFKYRPF